MTNQLAMIENEAVYMGRPIERSVVVEFAETLAGIHPQAGELNERELRTIAQLSLVTGANPLPGTNGIHVWKKDGKLVISFGVGFWRSQAEVEGGILWIFRPRPMTDSEREYYGITDGQMASMCGGVLKKNAFELMREAREFGMDMPLRDAKEEIARVGIGTVNNGEYAKKGRPQQWTADKRAETDLLRQLVPLMNRARQNAVSGEMVTGGLDWSAGEYAHFHSGEELPDDYGMGDANRDLFDDIPDDIDTETGEIIDVTPQPDPVVVETDKVELEIEEAETEPQQLKAEKPMQNGNKTKGKTPTLSMLRDLHALGTYIYDKDWDTKRAHISETFGKSSSKDWELDDYFYVINNLTELKESQMQDAD